MTPEEQFLAAMRSAHHPGRTGPKKTSTELLAELAQISEANRRLFLGGMQRLALPDLPLFPVPTTPRSPWYRRRCAECRHTFRVGDPAATCPRCGRVYHWNPVQGLDCLGVVFDNEEGCCTCREMNIPQPPPETAELVAPAQMTAFLNGISREWKVFGDWQPEIVGPELEGRLCAVCGHTVRQREMVVRCPCGNGPGGSCPAVIHLDFARQLHCWNDWNGGKGKTSCPLTGHEYQPAKVTGR